MTDTQPRAQFNSLSLAERQLALGNLLRERAGARPPEQPIVNLHCHTTYSYNGYGYSPSALVWLAAERGWRMLATVDFDVLDALDETYAAADAAAVRASVGIETRVYVPQFARWETNSPGEPGVMYHIGLGFAQAGLTGEAANTLADMRARAEARNRDMVARVNAYLAPVAVDYDRDVLPLTPAGNATERHLLIAYDAAARARFPRREALLAFWAEKLGLTADKVAAFLGDVPAPHDAVRGKLMKQGGVGYIQPDADTFPSFQAVNAMILAAGAVPAYGFVDGLSTGEAHLDELLETLVAQGIGAFNLVPDRNWNISDPAARAKKMARLYECLDIVRALDLPIIAGTEMNRAGLPLIDDFDAAPLRPLWGDFLRGADWLYGHTQMQRALGLGASSAWAQAHLPERRERNDFYIRVGRLVRPGARGLAALAQADVSRGPDGVLAAL